MEPGADGARGGGGCGQGMGAGTLAVGSAGGSCVATDRSEARRASVVERGRAGGPGCVCARGASAPSLLLLARRSVLAVRLRRHSAPLSRTRPGGGAAPLCAFAAPCVVVARSAPACVLALPRRQPSLAPLRSPASLRFGQSLRSCRQHCRPPKSLPPCPARSHRQPLRATCPRLPADAGFRDHCPRPPDAADAGFRDPQRCSPSSRHGTADGTPSSTPSSTVKRPAAGHLRAHHDTASGTDSSTRYGTHFKIKKIIKTYLRPRMKLPPAAAHGAPPHRRPHARAARSLRSRCACATPSNMVDGWLVPGAGLLIHPAGTIGRLVKKSGRRSKKVAKRFGGFKKKS